MLGFRSLNGENRQGPGMGVGGTQQGALVSVSGRLVFLFFYLLFLWALPCQLGSRKSYRIMISQVMHECS